MRKFIFLLAFLSQCAMAGDYLCVGDTNIKLGPFADETDGVTAETALTLTQADIRKSLNQGNFAQKADASACTHDEAGVYDCPLSAASDTDTAGNMMFMVDEAGATLVWWRGPIHPVPYCNILDGTDSLFTSQESGLLIKSTIATLASQTEFTLTGADNPVSNNDAYNEMTIIISGGGEADNGRVDDYTGSTGTVFLPAAFSFTIGVGDDVWILGDTLNGQAFTIAH